MSILSISTRKARCAVLAAAAAASCVAAYAETWPSKPITVVVPFPAGGGTDLVVRSIQPLLQRELGRPVVIDNRSGAGGTLGSAYVARAAADGYTAGVVTTSTHAVSVALYPKLPYNPAKDFAYAGFIGTSPYVLAVNNTLQVADAKALVSRLKADKAQHSFGSVGVGTVSHLMGEQFQKLVAVPMVHVPYRGAAPAYTDLIGGQVQIMFDNPVGLAPYIKAHKIAAIAVTAPTPLLPDVPTFASQGVPGFQQQLWYGIAFPKGTPAAIVDRFNAALNKVLSDNAVVADLSSKGVAARLGTPAALQAAVQADIPYWGKIASSVGATGE
ncbi:tripartite tricarboxylate transporter substrate binding protein [Cupriavidus sp. KK10]|jgi:tripartite-type tricarboxylate transporter receptor subunit TctC|uniref:Bug family tripartite tricarboxylate transporter substrate binding protein n=1 Tax=Cupriavidus sp. KK10 TaxID=1478019 RepID=UPI001BA7324C|nr:tripartite tricarboxylate transporter substrate binding protein [Cupriavidus sp. KK10]QUN30617.1 tripartite tricarboxylate transporter substrate binding protein [Cupriavidus sp. KK10]